MNVVRFALCICFICRVFAELSNCSDNDDFACAAKAQETTPLTSFQHWATEHGILYPNILINISNGEYFVLAKREIQVAVTNVPTNLQPSDLILEIPYDILLSEDSTPPKLRKVFDKHKELIYGKNKVALRLLYEKHSNPTSFWKPYIGKSCIISKSDS